MFMLQKSVSSEDSTCNLVAGTSFIESIAHFNEKCDVMSNKFVGRLLAWEIIPNWQLGGEKSLQTKLKIFLSQFHYDEN